MLTSEFDDSPRKRKEFFVIHYLRDLMHSKIANDIGGAALNIISTIALMEDEIRWERGVRIHDCDLRERTGLKRKAFEQGRNRAVEAGYLVYRNMGLRKKGWYRVTSPANFGAPSCVPESTKRSNQGAQEGAPHVPSPTPSSNPHVENKHVGKKKLMWKSLTDETVGEVVRGMNAAAFLDHDREGVKAFAWKDSEVCQRQRAALWHAAWRKAKADGGSSAAMLKAALKKGKAEYGNAADDEFAAALLKPPAPAIQIASPFQQADAPEPPQRYQADIINELRSM